VVRDHGVGQEEVVLGIDLVEGIVEVTCLRRTTIVSSTEIRAFPTAILSKFQE